MSGRAHPTRSAGVGALGIAKRAPGGRLGTRGESLVEYIILVGVVALLAIGGFKEAQKREHRAIDRQAQTIAQLDGSSGGFIDVGPYRCAGGYCVPGSGQCFAAGTPVSTEEGLRPIESVQEGDRVWARDERTGEVGLQPVLHRFVTPAQPVMTLSVAARDSSELLHVTSGHRFWVTAQGWVPAAELGAGQMLWSPSGEPLHVAPLLDQTGDYQTVYNFEVADFHTYFVGRHAVLVHNAGGDNPSDPCQAPPASAVPDPTGLVGTAFEAWLQKYKGASPNFKSGAREFDGAIGNRWIEAKSGNYWRDQTAPGSQGWAKFKSTTGDQQKIAADHGATLEVHSNSPIPQHVKDWLTARGIKYYEY